jgi:octaprenyl-diphosphate synthase
LHSEVVLVQQVGQYITQAGGKRLRPALLLLLARALGAQGQALEEAITLAAVVECIHTATLLHDDVVDESDRRRGRPTANAQFGNAAAVLVGDFLYSRAFQMMVGVGRMPVMAVLANVTNTIAEGEVLQLLNCNNPDITEQQYLQVIQYKTAKLFEASAQLAAIVVGLDSTAQQQWALFGQALGSAFQLIDDVLDYTGDAATLGKNVGDDLREGKATLPLIYALKHGPTQTQQLIRQALLEGKLESLPDIVAAIHACGGLEYTQQQAQALVNTALACLHTLTPSTHQEALAALCQHALQRTQ